MSITQQLNASNQKAFVLTTYDKTNHSPSQAKYTFGRASRFPSIQEKCPVTGYDLPTTKSPRAAGFGYGNKEIFKAQIRNTNSPSPDRYNLASKFDPKDPDSLKFVAFGKSKKSYCFGAGREDFSKTVSNTKTMYPDQIVPGPGTYADKTLDIGVNARKSTLKERKFYLDDDEMAKKLAIPGPGTYEDQQALHKEGKYISAQYM